MRIQSWGGMSGDIVSLQRPSFSSELGACVAGGLVPAVARRSVIGNLRSYGDEVLNPDGHYVQTTHCDRVLHIDLEHGLVNVESGLTLDVLQQRLAPLGYMLPVTPGTAYLTVGGAIANDVHGKNHHVAGSFGSYVEDFELVRTTGEVLQCSLRENADVFAATIGGLGLTGIITRARLTLRKVISPLLNVTSRRFGNLAEFFVIDAMEKDANEYAVAWVDCLAKGAALGRGIYSVANHSITPASATAAEYPNQSRQPSVPFALPVSPVNRWTLAALNAAYLRMHATGTRQIHFKKWLYPLDSIKHWNRLYGARGFRQFQCVVPPQDAHAAIAEMLRAVAERGQGSFLVVLKNFGDHPSPGLMSFPMPGTTLAMDFPNHGAATNELLLRLHAIAAAAGGRLYAAKDACSPGDSMARGYPHFHRFRQFIDRGLTSALAQRLQLTQ